MTNALALIADIGNFYGANARKVINQDFAKHLISILRKFNASKGQSEIVTYADNVIQ